ncbi:ABC transporter ATP-binding protein|uniref:Nickel transport system ATP-binding protein n=1 Tax=Dendrosporobacter quercicolus TaxID=146817 RepID=A0A1G9QVR5_9FIRM|nr:ABC transporter ATP-binding protein [Dendrosporobacter quercicolus]NSL48385.1 ABC transporter ATP-binding protein [Dendrosporobacter quercicolus DSM 1736]SDM15122.1 nickel transport system ATP-binding protein [Dendrosporobacter quercicolus]
MSLLNVRGLTVRDLRNGEVLVNNVDFALQANTCLGIVGESGSGKSVTCKALIGLTNPWLETTGDVRFAGSSLLAAPAEKLRQIRAKRICMILQDAMTAFDPLYTMGDQLIETLRETLSWDRRQAQSAALEALEKMCIRDPAGVMQKYPHQLSGGMLQRCMIALALAVRPDIVIADEPTTALDSINQREVVDEFRRLQAVTGTAIIFVSHDLGVVEKLAQQVLVMQNGERVEYGAAAQVFYNPQHEYTRYLVDTRIALTKPFRDAMIRRCKISC